MESIPLFMFATGGDATCNLPPKLSGLVFAAATSGVEVLRFKWRQEQEAAEAWPCVPGSRRHPPACQQAMIGADILPALEAEAKDRQRKAGGDKVSQAAKHDSTAVSDNWREARAGKASEQAAALVGVSERSIERAKAMAQGATSRPHSPSG